MNAPRVYKRKIQLSDCRTTKTRENALKIMLQNHRK